VTPGYDARIVFPHAGSYGFTKEWRDAQKRLALRYSTGGVSLDLWNGWTEGYAIPPSREDGDANYRWATDLISALKKR
jgi:hypothetical protein